MIAVNGSGVTAAIIISLIVISLIAFGMQDVELANANPIAYGPPKIAIVSPQYGNTCNSSQVILSVGIQLFGYTYSSLEAISWARYAVDNGKTAPLSLEMPTVIGPGTMINSTNVISNLSNGNHTINIFLETSFGESANANVTFTVNTKPSSTPSTSPTPSSNPTITASLSESASALNFGNTVNFTVNVEGGKAPYSYSWIVDDQLVETNSSPHYSTNDAAVGSHHVYVQVTDADNNSATTLTVEFNVLQVSNTSPSVSPNLSSSPTQQPTLEPSQSTSPTEGPFIDFPVSPLEVELGLIVLVLLAFLIAVLVYIKKIRKQK